MRGVGTEWDFSEVEILCVGGRRQGGAVAGAHGLRSAGCYSLRRSTDGRFQKCVNVF